METKSTFSATHNAISRCETGRREKVTRAIGSATCLAKVLRCKFQKNLPRVTAPLNSRFRLASHAHSKSLNLLKLSWIFLVLVWPLKVMLP